MPLYHGRRLSILNAMYQLIFIVHFRASCKTPKYVIPAKAGIYRINHLQIEKMDYSLCSPFGPPYGRSKRKRFSPAKNMPE